MLTEKIRMRKQFIMIFMEVSLNENITKMNNK